VSRLLGIDPGTVRCGIAITDSQQVMVFPRPAVSPDLLDAAIRSYIEEEAVIGLVVGRPMGLAGTSTDATNRSDVLFEHLLTAFTDVAMEQVDERFTTAQAAKILSAAGVSARDQRDVIDSASAVMLLEQFLELRGG
jgi:putative Holliday junction resolvase